MDSPPPTLMERAPSTAPASEIPLDCELLWAALTSDSGAQVAIIDSTGVVLRVSDAARRWPYTDREARGKNLRELLLPEFASERLAILDRCVREQRPLAVISTWRGVPMRTVLRPFRSVDGRMLVLATGRTTEDEPAGRSGDEIETIRARNNDDGPLAKLTRRETEVLALIAQGYTTAQIAKMLFRSAKTIEAHRLSLGLKLKVRNRVELTRIAMRAGLHHRTVLGTPREGGSAR